MWKQSSALSKPYQNGARGHSHSASFYPLNGLISTNVEFDTAINIVELMPQVSHIVQKYERMRDRDTIRYLYNAKHVLRALKIIMK